MSFADISVRTADTRAYISFLRLQLYPDQIYEYLFPDPDKKSRWSILRRNKKMVIIGDCFDFNRLPLRY